MAAGAVVALKVTITLAGTLVRSSTLTVSAISSSQDDCTCAYVSGSVALQLRNMRNCSNDASATLLNAAIFAVWALADVAERISRHRNRDRSIMSSQGP